MYKLGTIITEYLFDIKISEKYIPITLKSKETEPMKQLAEVDRDLINVRQ